MSENAKEWESVLAVYAKNPHAALVLAQLLDEVRKKIARGPKARREAEAQLEFAIKTLHRHTSFNKVSEKLYRLYVSGHLSAKQYSRLEELGVKF